MDPLIAAAANALAAGDPLRALNYVALRDEASALALRGIAMARLGDFPQARNLLKRAARAFGQKDPVPHARCVLAEAEIAFVSRDLGWPVKSLEAAGATLERHGNGINAIHARHLMARRALLLGDTGEAERVLAGINPALLPPARRAAHEMITADLALRRLQVAPARQAYARALDAAIHSRILPLRIEVETAARHLDVPVARLTGGGGERLLLPEDVETLLASGALIIDACRRVVRRGKVVVPLASRSVLFSLARALAEALPGDARRIELLKATFGARHADESHRARLRVEIGRLRQLLRGMAEIKATREGFLLRPKHSTGIHVLTWPVEEEHGDVLAFLADGEAWSSSALALALDTSQRTVQRALDSLAAEGKVRWFGKGRARRWTSASTAGFTTTMLLPAILTGA